MALPQGTPPPSGSHPRPLRTLQRPAGGPKAPSPPPLRGRDGTAAVGVPRGRKPQTRACGERGSRRPWAAGAARRRGSWHFGIRPGPIRRRPRPKRRRPTAKRPARSRRLPQRLGMRSQEGQASARDRVVAARAPAGGRCQEPRRVEGSTAIHRDATISAACAMPYQARPARRLSVGMPPGLSIGISLSVKSFLPPGPQVPPSVPLLRPRQVSPFADASRRTRDAASRVVSTYFANRRRVVSALPGDAGEG